MLMNYTSYIINQEGRIDKLNKKQEVPFELHGGNDRPIETHKQIIEKTIKMFANSAYRTILCTYRDMSMDLFNQLKRQNNNFATDKDREVLENDLVAIGMFGLEDPLRPRI